LPVERIIRLEALDDGVPQRVEVSGAALLVVKVDDEAHVLSDVCPHNGASLSEGVVREGCVTCPAHLWRFALKSGQRQGRPEVRVAVYPAHVSDDGWVEADVPTARVERSLREVLLAHARGEEAT
jgi:nitrite reductase/ring-hydroxylating ferredoxin subunit